MYAELITPPAIEPVSLEDAKTHLRVTSEALDTVIEALITAARQYAEEYTKRAFIQQTWRASLDAFPSGRIYLPKLPVLSVDSVEYTDGYGAAQSVTGYLVSKDPVRPYILPAYDTDWPIARDTLGSVTVTLKAGYGTASTDVPGPIKQAILLHVEAGHNRDPETAEHLLSVAKTLLDPFRVRRVP